MLRKIDSLIPSFLKKLDHHLLLNYPSLWATKIHYALFFGGIGYGILFFVSMINQVDLTSVTDFESSFAIILIPSGIIFLIWVYHVSIFQVEKDHGEKISESSGRDQLVYGLIIFMLAAAPFIFEKLAQNKIRRAISAHQLVLDINNLNLGENLFITDLPESGHNEISKNPENVCRILRYQGYNRFSYYGTSNPDVWSVHFIEKQLDSVNTRAEKSDLLGNYIRTFNKYSEEKIIHSPNEILNGYKDKTWRFEQIQYADAKLEVQKNIWAVQRAHTGRGIYADRGLIPIYLLILTTLWVALQALLKTNLKLFAGAALIGVTTAIILGITSATLNSLFNTDQEIFFLMIVGSFIFYLFQTFRKKHTRRFKVWKTISLTIVTVASPFIPLVLYKGLGGSILSDKSRMLIYLGIGLAIISWNILYAPRFSKLAAQPKEN